MCKVCIDIAGAPVDRSIGKVLVARASQEEIADMADFAEGEQTKSAIYAIAT